MFSISDSIDSKDIHEYNQNTEFTPIEQAVLIYHSKGTNVDEKWQPGRNFSIYIMKKSLSGHIWEKEIRI